MKHLNDYIMESNMTSIKTMCESSQIKNDIENNDNPDNMDPNSMKFLGKNFGDKNDKKSADKAAEEAIKWLESNNYWENKRGKNKDNKTDYSKFNKKK